MLPGDSIHVPPTTVHRMSAFDGDVVLVEVSTPEVDDVVRLEDDYNRI
jgi:D-lyxose ketol-isomerase